MEPQHRTETPHEDRTDGATEAPATSTGLPDRARPHTRAGTAAVLPDLAEHPAPARTAVNLTGA